MYGAPALIPSTPCGAPSTHLQCRRPARGRGMMCTLIHRSSALRASTDAYGACILRMRENPLCSGLHMRPCPMTLRRAVGRVPRQACSPFYPEDLERSKNVTLALSLRGDAFEWYGGYSSHHKGWVAKHPLAGARSIATWSRGVAPKTRGPGIVYDRDPARVSH